MAFSDGTADFRSDTVTRPTPAMASAMANAEVGDDVYAEDPTVNQLQEEAAELLGKDAALFTPTGSMGNQLAISLQTSPGDEVLCVERAHVRNYELGAGAAISGVQFRTVHTPDGEITPADVDEALDASSYHLPTIRLLSWENTHNVSGGTVVPLSLMQTTTAAARRHGLSVHLDGARMFNAVAASGVAAADYAAVADTVQFCFSKGLGAPIGSILCGSADLIGEARRLRKRLGGGMRQAGVLAAAAQVALERRSDLAADHAVARRLAEGIADRFPAAVDMSAVQTNMVIVDTTALPMRAPEFTAGLADTGILVGSVTSTRMRFVTHHNVDADDVDRVLSCLDRLTREHGRASA